MNKAFKSILLILSVFALVTFGSLSIESSSYPTINNTIQLTNHIINKVLRDNNETNQQIDFDCCDEILRDDSWTVLTPNGSWVPVTIVSSEWTQPDGLYSANHEYDNTIPEAVLVGDSSKRYNCHSYAWYMPSTSNPYWMAVPASYYLDGSYEEANNPIAGDVICYFDSSGFNIHSGIVIELLSGVPNGVCGNSNLVKVRSKWGDHGLYEHRGDHCPYTSNYGGSAAYVRYYRPRTNETIALSNPTGGTQHIQRNNTILQNCGLEDSYAMYALNVNWANNYSFEISSTNSLDVRLYDLHMQLVDIDNDSNYINGTYIVSFNEALSTGVYYLRVAYEDLDDYGTIYTEITNPHAHSYTNSYVWYNYTKHYSMCTCLSSVLSGHVVSQSAYNNGGQYATCLLCNGLASIGFIGPLNQKSLPTSLNGSFILPNGVIVLADEDWDAYLNGTLVFVVPNSN